MHTYIYVNLYTRLCTYVIEWCALLLVSLTGYRLFFFHPFFFGALLYLCTVREYIRFSGIFELCMLACWISVVHTHTDFFMVLACVCVCVCGTVLLCMDKNINLDREKR